jgi:hypothetical protein
LRKKWAVRLLPDRSFFGLVQDFFVLWWSGIFAGVFAQNACFGGGVFVVTVW